MTRLAWALTATAAACATTLAGAVWHELTEADHHHGIDPGYVVGQPLAILAPIAWTFVALTILCALVLILANPYSLPMRLWGVLWPWWTTDPDPRETGVEALDRAAITYTDPLTVPTVVVGERRARLRGWVAGALGAEDGMEHLVDQLTTERTERLALQAWAGEMATMLAAHDVPVPALRRPGVVLDETEAGAR